MYYFCCKKPGFIDMYKLISMIEFYRRMKIKNTNQCKKKHKWKYIIKENRQKEKENLKAVVKKIDFN